MSQQQPRFCVPPPGSCERRQTVRREQQLEAGRGRDELRRILA